MNSGGFSVAEAYFPQRKIHLDVSFGRLSNNLKVGLLVCIYHAQATGAVERARDPVRQNDYILARLFCRHASFHRRPPENMTIDSHASLPCNYFSNINGREEDKPAKRCRSTHGGNMDFE